MCGDVRSKWACSGYGGYNDSLMKYGVWGILLITAAAAPGVFGAERKLPKNILSVEKWDMPRTKHFGATGPNLRGLSSVPRRISWIHWWESHRDQYLVLTPSHSSYQLV